LAPPRPKSVTLISWLAIISGVGSALLLWSPAGREVMARVTTLHRVLTFGSIALQLLSAVVMLRGMNWARWAFVVTVVYHQLSKVVAGHWYGSPANLLGFLLVAAACYYLFRPAANAFFSGGASPAPKIPAGHAQCNECGQLFAVQDMVRHGTSYVCAACKPRFLQKLREGAAPAEPGPSGS
jgi:hypothetical protein